MNETKGSVRRFLQLNKERCALVGPSKTSLRILQCADSRPAGCYWLDARGIPVHIEDRDVFLLLFLWRPGKIYS